jgi:hypothetical protein
MEKCVIYMLNGTILLQYRAIFNPKGAVKSFYPAMKTFYFAMEIFYPAMKIFSCAIGNFYGTMP